MAVGVAEAAGLANTRLIHKKVSRTGEAFGGIALVAAWLAHAAVAPCVTVESSQTQVTAGVVRAQVAERDGRVAGQASPGLYVEPCGALVAGVGGIAM